MVRLGQLGSTVTPPRPALWLPWASWRWRSSGLGVGQADLLTIDALRAQASGVATCEMDQQGTSLPLFAGVSPRVREMLTAREARSGYRHCRRFQFLEDGAFKALALGSPFTKAICMGRALMIPGMVGKNIAQWMKDNDLPKTVSEFGNTVEEIFVNYEDVKKLVGNKEIQHIPLGAIGIYSYSQKIKVGLQQLMAGARCFNIDAITRKELMSLTDECAKVTGIPYLMDSYRDEAMKILNS